MEEFLTKINIVKKNNRINKLERENNEKQKKIEKYLSKSKEVITQMEIEKRTNVKMIEELSEENKRLQYENNNYKYILNRIPNWAIRIFAGKNKRLGG